MWIGQPPAAAAQQWGAYPQQFVQQPWQPQPQFDPQPQFAPQQFAQPQLMPQQFMPQQWGQQYAPAPPEYQHPRIERRADSRITLLPAEGGVQAPPTLGPLSELADFHPYGDPNKIVIYEGLDATGRVSSQYCRVGDLPAVSNPRYAMSQQPPSMTQGAMLPNPQQVPPGYPQGYPQYPPSMQPPHPSQYGQQYPQQYPNQPYPPQQPQQPQFAPQLPMQPQSTQAPQQPPQFQMQPQQPMQPMVPQAPPVMPSPAPQQVKAASVDVSVGFESPYGMHQHPCCFMAVDHDQTGVVLGFRAGQAPHLNKGVQIVLHLPGSGPHVAVNAGFNYDDRAEDGEPCVKSLFVFVPQEQQSAESPQA